MTLRSYLIIMISATFLCWISWASVLFSVNPETTNRIGFVLFYLSLFLSLTGTAAIVGFLIRFAGLKRELAFYSVREAFRQSFFFAFLIVAVLFLLSKNFFTWWNLGLLVAGLTILEVFLMSYQKNL